MKLFEIFGEVRLEDNATKGLDGIDKKGESTAKKFGSSMKKIGKGALILGAAATGAATGLGAIATKTADAGDRIDKMSQKLGLSREGFQEWDYILSQNGASIDSMGSGMKTLVNQMDDMAKGGKESTRAFKRLNIEMEDLEGLTQEEIFEKTIVALQDVESETERAAIANRLLGRSGQELAPLLNAGADSVENLKKQAGDLGLVMGDDAIDASVKFTDTMDTLKRSFGMVGLELGTALIPVFEKLATWTIDNLPTIKKFFKDAFDTIFTVANKAYDIFEQYFLPVIIDMYNWVKDNWPQLQMIGEGVFRAIFTVVSALWEKFKEHLLPILKNVFQWVSDNWPTFQSIFETVFDAVLIAIDAVYAIFGVLWDVMKSVYDWVEPHLPAFGEFISDAFDIIVDSVQLGIDIFNGIKTAAEDAINWIKEGLEWIGILNKEGTNGGGGGSSWTTGTPTPDPSGFGSRNKTENLLRNFGGFKANGGPVSSSESYVVGEQGPELFTPNSNGFITPNQNMTGGNVTVNTMIVRKESDVKKVARELYKMQLATARG
jgi:hypothetical protein